MNIRSAILAAADHIEANPSKFMYYRPEIDGDGIGCALARIDEMSGGVGRSNSAGKKLGLGWAGGKQGVSVFVDFYSHMQQFDGGWFHSAERCAGALRKYADAYFPASPSLDPAYVSWRDALKRENGYGVTS